jgi:hypothetical protein
MRDGNGRFKKGFSSSPSTQFKKGQHWRKSQLFRDKAWLMQNYVILQRSTSEIANEFGVTDSAILFWLKKHNIQRRTVNENCPGSAFWPDAQKAESCLTRSMAQAQRGWWRCG